MQKASSLDTTEEDYYKIISAKTSSLFIAAVKSMVHTTGASDKIMNDMESYAYNLGLAFQIRDDIFDYTPQLNTGKPSGGDIKEKKLTLPLILALKAADKDERESLLREIRFAGAEDERLVEDTFALVEKYSGVAAAQKVLEKHCREAEKSLSGLSESIYKNHLIELTRYVGSRES
jgi:octaprenyl-diphosphate synthase